MVAFADPPPFPHRFIQQLPKLFQSIGLSYVSSTQYLASYIPNLLQSVSVSSDCKIVHLNRYFCGSATIVTITIIFYQEPKLVQSIRLSYVNQSHYAAVHIPNSPYYLLRIRSQYRQINQRLSHIMRSGIVRTRICDNSNTCSRQTRFQANLGCYKYIRFVVSRTNKIDCHTYEKCFVYCNIMRWAAVVFEIFFHTDVKNGVSYDISKWAAVIYEVYQPPNASSF